MAPYPKAGLDSISHQHTAGLGPDLRSRILKALLDVTTDMAFVSDRSGTFLHAGRGAAAVFGLNPDDFLGKRIVDSAIPRPVADKWECAWTNVLTNGRTVEAAFQAADQEGYHHFEYRAIPVSGDGIVEAVITWVTGINSRRRFDADVGDSEARFRALAETLPQLVWIAGSDGRFQYLNRRWCEYTGMALPEILEDGWARLTPPDETKSIRDAWETALSSAQCFEIEVRLRSVDDRYHWFLTRGEPLTDATNAVYRWFGTCTNIHEQKRSVQTERFFSNMSDRMRMTLEPDLVLWGAISATGEYLNVSRCSYSEVNVENAEITVHRDYCQNVSSHSGTFSLSQFGEEMIGEVLRGRTVACGDTATDPRTRDQYLTSYAPMEIRAFIAVPLIRNARCVGMLSVHHAKPRDWETSEVELLETVAERTWLAWENVNLLRRSAEADARQRFFLRDVLASVTEGRLVLCHAQAELPRTLEPVAEPFTISAVEGMAGIRNIARLAAERLGFDSMRSYDLVTAVGEAAMNAVVHAGGGIGRVYTDGEERVQVWIVDEGAGIDVAALPHATLKFGYTTAGSLGHGMKMMLQTADNIYLMTNSKGTTVVIQQNRIPPEPFIGK